MTKIKELDLAERISVSDDEWQYRNTELLNAYINDPGDGTVSVSEMKRYRVENKPTASKIQFYRTGDLVEYLAQADKHGFIVSWGDVIFINFDRKLTTYLENFNIFWAWVLKDPSNRIHNPGLYKEPKLEKYLWEPFSALASGWLLQDPQVTCPLFIKVFGETFTPTITFPVAVGETGWQPTKEITAKEMFINIRKTLSPRLFGEKTLNGHYLIGENIVFSHLEYWFSCIEIIKDDYFGANGYCDLMMADAYTEKNDEQYSLRTFFIELLGYPQTGYSPEETFDHHPDVREYILARFMEMDMPDEFHRFIDFIHRHQGDAAELSEGE